MLLFDNFIVIFVRRICCK